MAAQRDTVMMKEVGRPARETAAISDPVSPPTLADAVIDKHLADRARKYAAIPEDEFNDIVTDWRERVSADRLLMENVNGETRLLLGSRAARRHFGGDPHGLWHDRRDRRPRAGRRSARLRRPLTSAPQGFRLIPLTAARRVPNERKTRKVGRNLLRRPSERAIAYHQPHSWLFVSPALGECVAAFGRVLKQSDPRTGTTTTACR